MENMSSLYQRARAKLIVFQLKKWHSELSKVFDGFKGWSDIVPTEEEQKRYKQANDRKKEILDQKKSTEFEKIELRMKKHNEIKVDYSKKDFKIPKQPDALVELNGKVDALVITAESMKKKVEVYNNLLLENAMWEKMDPCRNINVLDAFDWMASSGKIIDKLKSDIEKTSKGIDKTFEQAKSQVEGKTSRVLVKKASTIHDFLIQKKCRQ